MALVFEWSSEVRGEILTMVNRRRRTMNDGQTPAYGHTISSSFESNGLVELKTHETREDV